MSNSPGEGGGGGGYSGFQETGVIEGVFGFELFNWGIFSVGKFGKYFLEWLVLNRDFWGVFKTI